MNVYLQSLVRPSLFVLTACVSFLGCDPPLTTSEPISTVETGRIDKRLVGVWILEEGPEAAEELMEAAKKSKEKGEEYGGISVYHLGTHYRHLHMIVPYQDKFFSAAVPIVTERIGDFDYMSLGDSEKNEYFLVPYFFNRSDELVVCTDAYKDYWAEAVESGRVKGEVEQSVKMENGRVLKRDIKSLKVTAGRNAIRSYLKSKPLPCRRDPEKAYIFRRGKELSARDWP